MIRKNFFKRIITIIIHIWTIFKYIYAYQYLIKKLYLNFVNLGIIIDEIINTNDETFHQPH